MRRAALSGVMLAPIVGTAALGQPAQQSPKLTGAGEIGQGRFGVSVALSADGNTALIGGNTDNNTQTFGVGAAWVFTRTGSNWAPQGPKLTAGDGVNLPAFGWDVALSADGNTALIGGPGDHGNIGAVWTFTRSDGTWTQQGSKLTAAGEIGAGRFGETVALSADGNTAVVGAPNEADGVLRVYVRSGGGWVQQGPALVGSDGVGFVFLGQDLALSANGNTILASGENENSAVGAAWVFARSNGTWSQQGDKLTVATSGSSPRFGAGVALSADGNLALIGASREAGVGGMWQFARSGSTWAQVGTRVTPNDTTSGAGFGGDIALSADGSTALVGGSGDSSQRGAAWFFTRAGSTYQQQGPKFFPADLAGSIPVFGASVALSASGATALVSAPNDNTARGAAWTYVNPDAASAPGAPTNASGVAGDGQAEVSFTPALLDGGTSVGWYTVNASPGGASASGSGSPVTIFGLEDGVAYTFTVTGTNGYGTSAPSAPSAAVTPMGATRPHPDPPAAPAPRPDVPTPPPDPGVRQPPPPH